MPHLVIDGQRLEAADGKTVIEVAYENGMTIPHFCWHPELSVAGNCRMCLVEVGMPRKLPDGSFEKDENGDTNIGFFPKLQIACATYVTDEMVVNTRSERAVEAQEAVMEFLLINHPLDCPICDEAGECKLQEYAFRHSKGESRFEERKNHKPKRQVWGPNILFDAERCISCSRCIRYAKEQAEQDVLTFVQRGDHVTIELFEGTQFDSPYSMNVIEICPVGALTSPDFRFKSRVWEMSFNDSICPGCAKGCNIKIGVRNNEILRLQPRSNPYVNRFWMCDHGRLTQYKFVNEARITEPHIKENERFKDCTWKEAVEFTSFHLKKFKPHEIMVIGSPQTTNEDNYLLQKFAKKVLRTSNIDFFRTKNENFQDNYLRVSDMTPNTTGAIEVGVKPGHGGINISDLSEKLNYGHIRALFVMDEDFSDHGHLFDTIKELDFLVVLTSNESKLANIADAVLPITTYAESEGTFTNIEGRVQYLAPALVTKDNYRFMGMKMSRIDKFGAHNDRWTQHEKRNCKQSWRAIQMIANLLEANWDYSVSEDVFMEISENINSFHGMSYELLEKYQGLVLGKANSPDEKVVNYVSHEMKPSI